ncbi:MAG TPA: acyltransferase domain-containing protein [Candidatus Dormibacteraeota bacterium]|nr:acyltransferase domain-containing protein [Candidatus Dormibacteraeota bacterium]
MGSVFDALRSEPETAAWLSATEADDGGTAEVAVPPATGLLPALIDLAVPHEDINEIVGLRDRMTGDDELRWLIERSARRFIRGIGSIGEDLELPFLPESLGPAGRQFWVFVFLAARPHVIAYHRAHRIPEEVSRHTLADLGRHMAIHRRRHGTGGLLGPGWIQLHFRGEIYQLGRLQFQRARLGDRTGTAAAEAGLGVGPGGPGLDIHIPDFCGPMTPEAVAESLCWAAEFFPRHFPDETYTVGACHSWLLDPQLADYLGDGSNIVAFQHRFTVQYTEEEPSDRSPVGFVFGNRELPVETLPRRTRLERAVVDHLLAGRHWYSGVGILRL